MFVFFQELVGKMRWLTSVGSFIHIIPGYPGGGFTVF